jgi:hypothetical protein
MNYLFWACAKENISYPSFAHAQKRVDAQYGSSFFTIFVFHKSPHSNVKFLIFCGTIG